MSSARPPLVPPEQEMTWASLKNRLRDERDWMFRGQQRLSWRLESSLERAVASADERAKAEETLRFLFIQAAANYLPSGQLPRQPLDWLATMQHHGTPTRLLDFTRSPYIAAYFAIEDASKDEPCAIWAISESWCRSKADEALRRAGLGSAGLPTFSWLYQAQDWQPVALVAPAGSMQMSTRQIAQQALFGVSGDLSLSFEENLRAMVPLDEDIGEHVKCYQISGDKRGEVLRDLRLMNISRASLYPGLDGFAQSLRYSLVDEDIQRWIVRCALRGKHDLSF